MKHILKCSNPDCDYQIFEPTGLEDDCPLCNEVTELQHNLKEAVELLKRFESDNYKGYNHPYWLYGKTSKFLASLKEKMGK